MSTPLTYKRLLEEQEHQVQFAGLNSRTAANRATALRGFMKSNRLNADDVVGLELRAKFPEATEIFVEYLREQNRSSRDITNTLSALRPWKEATVAYDTAQALQAELPTPFVTALRSLTEGQNIASIRRRTDVPKDMLRGWLKGKRPRDSSAKYIRRLETYFGLERDSLIKLSGVKEVGQRPEGVGGPSQPIGYRKLIRELTSFNFYIKPDAASPLRKQWGDLLVYKTAASLSGKQGKKRSRKGKWRISPCPLTVKNDKSWWAFLPEVTASRPQYKEVASARFAWAKTSGYLGWLQLSPEEGGIGFTQSEVETLAWLAIPDFLEIYLDWTKERVNARNQGTIQHLGYIASLVRPEEGYLRQSPDLQATLPEAYRTRDWQELCDETFKLTQELTASYQDEIKVTRDSFAPIMHILQMPQPMDAIADMVQRMRADRPVAEPHKEAVWSRDLVLIKLLASNPLRMRNLAHLTWRADNTGELHQQEDGSWWIKIHKSRFKNTKGAAGSREFYECQVNQSAWTDIERYLRTYRPQLMLNPTDLFFLSTKTGAHKSDDAVPWADLSKRVSYLTAKYLYRCAGIGAHAFRHIVATSILKASGGDFRTAALVLHDRVATVEKHYAFLTANDGASKMSDLLQSSFSRM